MQPFAQLTITSDQFAQGFTQRSASSQTQYSDTGAAGLQALVNQTGANQTWSFQGLPFVLNTSSNGNSSVVAYPGGAALADSFPTATHVIISSSGGNTSYGFYEINQNGFYFLGNSQIRNGTPSIEVIFTPALQEFAFPLSYQTSWTGTSAVSAGGGYIETYNIDGLVDGWGSYGLPGNITNQALRVKTKSSIFSPQIINGKDTIPAYNDVRYSFLWFSLSGYSVTINADTNQKATDANYSIPNANSAVLNILTNDAFSIRAASNPISFLTNVSFTLPSESQVRISLLDPLGRESQVLMNGMAHSGVNTLSLDPANLMNGTYFLRIESGGNSAMQKVIVNH